MHFCVISSKVIKLTVLMVVVAILLSIGINGATSAQVFFGYNTKKVPVYCVETDKKQVAISFDAAWGADKTLKIIETLKEFNCGGTFFLVGFWVDKYPDMVRAINEAGIEIGNHSNTHPDLTNLDSSAVREELSQVNKMIEAITNKPVELFRCPYGAYNDTVINVVEEMGMIPVQWDVDSLDWQGLTGDQITTRVINQVKNGSIILCHNNSDYIIEGLTMVLDRLTMQGYEVVSIGELVYHDNYAIDRTGMQKLNKE